MVYKRFQGGCIVRVVLIGGSLYLFFWLVFFTQFHITTMVFAIVPILQLVELLHFVQKTNRALTQFLQAIQYADFTTKFPRNPADTTFGELYQALNQVMQQFQRIRTEKEAQFFYLQTVVQHIGIGVIVFTGDGRIDLVNRAFKRMFGVRGLRNIAELYAVDHELPQFLRHIADREHTLFTLQKDRREEQFAVSATHFLLHQTTYTLASFQNIQPELDAHEMLSWQKLIRVLNHEIMNSLTPITSLASTANALVASLREQPSAEHCAQELEKIQSAIGVIERRSQGLLDFVNNYRKLMQLPSPVFQDVPIATLFTRIRQLLTRQIEDKEIVFTLRVEPDNLQVRADENLFEQVLLNLLENAIAAVAEVAEPHIELSAGYDQHGKVIVQVTDNGYGITSDAQEKIFIPFFTTRKQGTGIGLSISREIMRLHGGTISVTSEPHVKTIFSLRFNQ
jgi:two-component system, NtrC family, nitrogen regulation sensor histidine kinase NtrY